jgi:hypothetical protein
MDSRCQTSSAASARAPAVALSLLCGLAGGACGTDTAAPGLDATPEALDGATPGDAVGPDAQTPPSPHVHWATFEATLDRPVTEANPFDPAQIAIDVTFEAPAGAAGRGDTGAGGASWTVPAFVTRDFTRALDNDAEGGPRERLTEAGDLVWRVRFRPPMDAPGGPWRWSWRARTPAGETTAGPFSFTPTPDATTHGVVRVSPADPRRLAYEDGAPFIALGENLAWYDRRGTYAYDAWLADIAQSGGNFIRLWMPSWAFGVEWSTTAPGGALEGRLGDYGHRLDRAWRLDHVLARARSLGVQVLLTIQNHGPFSTVHASEWQRNPYNAALGGPLARPSDVFSDPTARALFARRLRYLVARWGHHPNLLGWELWNEVDLVESPESPAVLDWHRDMIGQLAALDMHDHLVTTSLGGLDAIAALLDRDLAPLTARHAPLWSLDGLDFTQLHAYGVAALDVDFSRALRTLTPYLAAFGRPLVVAEAGVSAVSAEETQEVDPRQVAFTDILWGGLFAGGFGGGMSWWWDSIAHPDALYLQYAPLATLLAGVSPEAERFVPFAEDLPGHIDTQLQTLVGASVALAWLRDNAHTRSAPSERVIDGAEVAIAGVGAGRWRGIWLRPEAGWRCPERFPCEVPASSLPGEVEVTVGDDGVATVSAPAFQRHLALRLTRVD